MEVFDAPATFHVDKDEYLALIERQFKAADLNHDGKVTSAEFKARSGLPLRRLLY